MHWRLSRVDKYNVRLEKWMALIALTPDVHLEDSGGVDTSDNYARKTAGAVIRHAGIIENITQLLLTGAHS